MLARPLLSVDGCFEDVSYKSAIALVNSALNHILELLFLVALYAVIRDPKYTRNSESICKWKTRLPLITAKQCCTGKQIRSLVWNRICGHRAPVPIPGALKAATGAKVLQQPALATKGWGFAAPEICLRCVKGNGPGVLYQQHPGLWE